MRRRPHRLRPFAVCLTTVATVSGCGITHPGDLNFRVDKRLTFTTPPARSLVQLPVHLSWTIHDFTIAPPGSAPVSRDAGYFVVFVDRAPVHPGQTLSSVGSGDPSCQVGNACLSRAYLSTHQVYPVTKPKLTLTQIPALAGSDTTQSHTATVVLMDTSGHRIGESAWELDFRMRKTSP